MWNKGFKQALEVGERLSKILPERVSSEKLFSHEHQPYTTDEWYWIEALQNCREQGITIWFPTLANFKSGGITFYVCQHRNSDSIGYYMGDHTFHGVSQKAYENGFISCESTQQCAQEIADWINTIIS